MRRIRVGIIGAGPATEWAVLPALSGPDAVSPPDNGASWTRRPSLHTDIQYQPPARPEVVALADADVDRLERVALAARVPVTYTDWRRMLREVQLDALICVPAPEDGAALAGEVVIASSAHSWELWLDGPPAQSVEKIAQLIKSKRASHLHLGQPLRQALAHREAFRAIARGDIGEVTAIHARWNSPFEAADHSGDALAFANSYAALDLLLGLVSSNLEGCGVPTRVMASTLRGATNLLAECGNGVSITALFVGADPWSCGLPRIEVCGSEGQFIVCEGGRSFRLHRPRQPALLLEPPGLAQHLSGANITGVAEAVKAFLIGCAEDGSKEVRLDGALHTLQLWEAARESLQTDSAIDIESRLPETVEPDGSSSTSPSERRQAREKATLTLKLN